MKKILCEYKIKPPHAMSALEAKYRDKLIRELIKAGSAHFADYLKTLNMHFLFNSEQAYTTGAGLKPAYMDPSTNEIYIDNWILHHNIKASMLFAKHEMEHSLAEHCYRAEEAYRKWYADEQLKNPLNGKRKDSPLNYYGKEDSRHIKVNLAGDYHMSGEIYDKDDLKFARGTMIGSYKFIGLVLEDQHPEWLGMTYEEILKEIEDNPIPFQQYFPMKQPDNKGGGGGGGGGGFKRPKPQIVRGTLLDPYTFQTEDGRIIKARSEDENEEA